LDRSRKEKVDSAMTILSCAKQKCSPVFLFQENDSSVILFDLRQPTAIQVQQQIEIQMATWHFFWILKLTF